MFPALEVNSHDEELFAFQAELTYLTTVEWALSIFVKKYLFYFELCLS